MRSSSTYRYCNGHDCQQMNKIQQQRWHCAAFPGGVYYYRLQLADGRSQTFKLIIL